MLFSSVGSNFSMGFSLNSGPAGLLEPRPGADMNSTLVTACLGLVCPKLVGPDGLSDQSTPWESNRPYHLPPLQN